MAKIIEMNELRNKNYVFRDRVHAGELLASILKPYIGKDSIVLAIPSGGVPVGNTIAKKLGLQMVLIQLSQMSNVNLIKGWKYSGKADLFLN